MTDYCRYSGGVKQFAKIEEFEKLERKLSSLSEQQDDVYDAESAEMENKSVQKSGIAKMIPVIIYPYLFMIAFIGIILSLVLSSESESMTEMPNLVIIFFIIQITFVTGACFFLSIYNTIKASINSYGVINPLKVNLIIKCLQILSDGRLFVIENCTITKIYKGK